MKTSTILPFFKWRTNGTTRKLIVTNSPRLYSVAGTAYPKERTTVEETTTEPSNFTYPICVTVKNTADANSTAASNSTGNSTGIDTTLSDQTGATAADAATTAGGGGDGGDGGDAPTTVAPDPPAE